MADTMTAEEKAKLEAAEKEKTRKAAKDEPSPLMSEAMRAYGIRPDHVMGSKDYGNYVRIVTKGGRRVTFTAGDKVERLSPIDLTGKAPPKPKK